MKNVSVIIPSYNQARFVGSAIQSVLNQSYPAHEIIVVDDGSKDNIREEISRYESRVRYIWQENQGLAGARNTGLQHSTGDLVGLLDADDEWLPNYLENMVHLADENPGADVFYCMARCMDIDGNDLPQFVGGPPVEPQELYFRLLDQNFIIPSTVLFRKKTIIEAGSFDAELRSCEDWDLWLRLLPKRKMMGSPNTLVHYRVHGSSLSTNVQGMQDAAKKVIEKHYGTDDGKYLSWTAEKRRAYGGMYRYNALTFTQRQNNWDAAEVSVGNALQMYPSLAMDLSFFYDLALGNQPMGYRGAGELAGFEEKATRMEKLIRNVTRRSDIQSIRKMALGTCYFALGLVSYNIGKRSKSRRYLLKALFHRPELILDFRTIGNYIKSFISKDDLVKMRKFLRSAS